MTTPQLIGVTCVYAVAFIAVVLATRATARRALGALVGGAAAGIFFLGAGLLGMTIGWWQGPLPSTPSLATLFFVGTATSLAPTYPITWRVARRFGSRGLGVCLITAALVGPPRDYLIAAAYPEWVVFAPGLAPVLGVAATYVGLVAVGHATMRLVAGPAHADRLAQRPWGRPDPSL